MEAEGNVVTYLTDCEFGPDDDISKPMELAKDADYFIFDSQYTDEEYKNRLGWGPSPWTTGVKIAKKAGVKTLVLFHHDPYHNDKFMDSMLEEVREQFPNTIAATRCLELELKPSRKKNKIKEKIYLSVNEFFEFEGNCFSDPKNNKLVVFCPQNMVEKNCREFFKKAGQNFQDSIHKIEIYFDRCPQMGSQALGNFVKFIALAKTAKKEVYVGGLSKALKQTFRISHVDQLVKSLD